jgi:hypothetical protein
VCLDCGKTKTETIDERLLRLYWRGYLIKQEPVDAELFPQVRVTDKWPSGQRSFIDMEGLVAMIALIMTVMGIFGSPTRDPGRHASARSDSSCLLASASKLTAPRQG